MTAEFARRPAAALCLIAAVVAQAWLTLTLFGGRATLTDSQLPTGGSHPANWWRGSSPAGYLFHAQAGSLPPPTASAGQRCAEAFRFAFGRLDARDYKLGLALACVAAPLAFALAARTLDYGAGVASLAAWLGVIVWWSPPLRTGLESGELDRVFAALAALPHVTALHAYHRRPGPGNWFLLFASAAAGWSLHVPIWAVVTTGAVVGWLAVGRRHGPEWHLGLLEAWALAAVVAWPAIDDWRRHWWMLRPFGLPVPSFGEWHNSWWADENGLNAAVLIAIALLGGLAPRALTGDRRARWLAGGLGVILLASLGPVPESHDGPTATGLIGLAVCLAVPAAAGTLAMLADHIRGRKFQQPRTNYQPEAGKFQEPRTIFQSARSGLVIGSWFLEFPLVVAVIGGVAVAGPLRHWQPGWGPRPLRFGGSAAASAWAAEFLRQTSPNARVVWEESPHGSDETWAVAVPYLSRRSLIGGHGAMCEHGYADLRDGQLCGRPIADWSDAELEEYFRRYNVGWVRCVSPAARARLGRYAAAKRLDMPPGPGGSLYAIARPATYFLHGRGGSVVADGRRWVLTDVAPESGYVVLSLHHHRGLKAVPCRAFVEREPDVHDPIPFVRLHLAEPASRVVLEWVE